MSNAYLAIQLLIQIAVILGTCRVIGLIAARCGQPQVIAEMIAGICLGPSLLGMYFPEMQVALFPWDSSARDTQSYLYPIAQLGLVLYMFVIGLEFRIDVVQTEWKSAVAVSIAGMLIPLMLGMGLGWGLHRSTSLFPASNGVLESSLFLGVSLCITAFPMLARILHEKGLTGTRIGTVSLGAGAIGDAVAWCLLALVFSSLESRPSDTLLNILGGLFFVVVIAFVVRPILARFESAFIKHNQLTDSGFVVCLMLMSLASLATDVIGLHAVFGAFVIGVVMPRGRICTDAIARIEPLTVALLLPLFFTFSGLNTRIGLLDSWKDWGFCVLIVLTAVVGKCVASWGAARATGFSHREALSIGVLMNTRGMMELIVINVGREKGLISDELFAMLVVMALVTTLMTAPAFDRIVRRQSVVIGCSDLPANLPASR